MNQNCFSSLGREFLLPKLWAFGQGCCIPQEDGWYLWDCSNNSLNNSLKRLDVAAPSVVSQASN